MPPQPPSLPVLAVATDVFQDLKGEDVLPALWTLFTKCKGSLKDGYRFENISWRLWSKSLAVLELEPSQVHMFGGRPVMPGQQLYRPPTPEEIRPLLPVNDTLLSSSHTAFVPNLANPPTEPHRSSSNADSVFASSGNTHSPRNSGRTKPPVSVGKILCDVLSSTTLPPLSPSPRTPSPSKLLSPLSDLPIRTIHPPGGQSQFTPSCLPTPEAEPGELNFPSAMAAASTGSILHPNINSASNIISLSADIPVVKTSCPSPSKSSGSLTESLNQDRLPADSALPRLVIVKPTPNPTPQPTPPASPIPQRQRNLAQRTDQDHGLMVHLTPLQVLPCADRLAPIQTPFHNEGQCSESDQTNDLTDQTYCRLQAQSDTRNPVREGPENRSPHSSTSETSSDSQTGSSTSECSTTTVTTTMSEPAQHAVGEKQSGVAVPQFSSPPEMVLSSSPPSQIYKQASTEVNTTGKDDYSEPSTMKAAGSLASNVASSPGQPTPSIRQMSIDGPDGETKDQTVKRGSATSFRSRSQTREVNGTITSGMTKVFPGKGGSGRVARRVVGGTRVSKARIPLRKQSLNEAKKGTGKDLPDTVMGSNKGLKAIRNGSETTTQQHVQLLQKHGFFEVGVSSRKDEMDMESNCGDAHAAKPRESMKRDGGKGKEKEIGGAPEEQKKMKGRHDMTVMVRVEDTIADPLLPGSGHPQIVLTSDSEYETETDTLESNESADIEVPVGKDGNTKLTGDSQQLEVQPQLLPSQQRQHHPSIFAERPPLQRTQSHNLPRNHPHVHHQQLAQQMSLEQARKDYEKDMFAKLPVKSLQNVNDAKRKNVSLLSLLLNPDPSIFPPDHPYRRRLDSKANVSNSAVVISQHNQQIQSPGFIPPRAAPVNAQIQRPPHPSILNPIAAQFKSDARYVQNHNRPLPSRLAALRAPQMGGKPLGKSPVANPVTSQLYVGSVNGVPAVASSRMKASGSADANAVTKPSAYRPKPRPPETILEDTSDSETDENQLQLSKSVAQEKLKLLLEKKQSRKGKAKVTTPAPVVDQPTANEPEDEPQFILEAMPISAPRLIYPYNLPAPEPPSTPRTTRRRMLQVEIAESLRINLLWMRQVNQPNPPALVKRTRSKSYLRHRPKLPPLTTVVKLTPKGQKPEEPQETEEEKRERIMAKILSCEFDYHIRGW